MTKSKTRTRTGELYEKNDKNGNLNKSFNGFENTNMAPILSILNIVRKSLRKFLLSPNDFREAKSVMMKVFRNFDPQENNKLSPRDFSFAVSVLINEIRDRDEYTVSDKNTVSSKSASFNNSELSSKLKISSPPRNVPKNIPWRVGSSISSTRENYSSSKNNSTYLNNNNNEYEKDKNKDPRNVLCSDVPILTSNDWNSIFQYFANETNNNKSTSNNSRNNNLDITINYEKFCNLVLNQEEIKKMSLLVKSSTFQNFGKPLNKSVDVKTRKLSSSHFNLDDVSTAASRVRASSASRSRIELNSKNDNKFLNYSNRWILEINNHNNILIRIIIISMIIILLLFNIRLQ